MQPDLPHVVVGGPVRDREWSIPLWLGGLLELDYPRDRLHLAVLVNDSRDDTFDAARAWAHMAHEDGWGSTAVKRHDLGTTADNNIRNCRRDYAAFALVRDAWVELALDLEPRAEWLFPVDSDVQVTSDCLRRLVAHATESQFEMLAAVLDNSHGAGCTHHSNVMMVEQSVRLSRADIRTVLLHLTTDQVEAVRRGDETICRQTLEQVRSASAGAPDVGIPTADDYVHPTWAYELREDRVIPCDLTGACAVLHRAIFDAGIRYEVDECPHPPEDMRFCQRVKALGYRIGCVPGLRVTHWMKAPEELSWLRSAAWHERLARYHTERAEKLHAEG